MVSQGFCWCFSLLVPSCKVTEVTMLYQIFKKKFFTTNEVTKLRCFFKNSTKKSSQATKLRSYKSYDGFSGLLLMFFPTGPKLRGYGSYDAFFKFSKKNLHKLQSYRSYEGYSGLLLMIFPIGPLVARLRKLRPELWSNPSMYLAISMSWSSRL